MTAQNPPLDPANDELRSARAGRGNIEDIARRLDDLLQCMAEVPSAPASRKARTDAVEAARREWHFRRLRDEHFDPELFRNVHLDVVIYLFVARAEERQVTVATLCRQLNVSETAMLRCIATLIEAGLVTREGPGIELHLTEQGGSRLCDYFSRTSTDLDVAGA